MSKHRIIVTHTSYGCDTGCCGHVVEIDGEIAGRFAFGHDEYTREELRQNVLDQGCDPATIDWSGFLEDYC